MRWSLSVPHSGADRQGDASGCFDGFNEPRHVGIARRDRVVVSGV